MCSPPESETTLNCTACGATIYQEHLYRGLAARWAGNLLCHHCLKEQKGADQTIPHEGDMADLELADNPDSSDPNQRSSVRGPGGSSITGALGMTTMNFKRPLTPTGKGATRIRTFYAKLVEGAIQHLDSQVNAWLDNNPDIEIKFANTVVGRLQDKRGETCLIMTIFY